MSSLRLPWPPVKPACPTCGDTGYLPDPFPARAGDYIRCPVCNPDGAVAGAGPPPKRTKPTPS